MMSNFSVHNFTDREIYGVITPEIILNVSEEEFERTKAEHFAISQLSMTLFDDQMDFDQFLDGVFDVMGKQIDPYLDEVFVGLSNLCFYESV